MLEAAKMASSQINFLRYKYLSLRPLEFMLEINCHPHHVHAGQGRYLRVFVLCAAGAPDDLQRVYYYWAIQQDSAGAVGADGEHYPPRWQLREMLVRGMHALIG